MTDLFRQLHGYGEQLEAQMGVLEVEDVRFVRVGSGPVRPILERDTRHRRRWLITVVTVVVAVIVGVGGWFVVARRGTERPVITTPPVVTSTTGVPTTTTTTSPRPRWGLDALATFHAEPVPPAATCPLGSAPDEPGDPTAPRPPTTDGDRGLAAFDRQSGLLVLRGRTWTWVFDVCRNRWEERVAAGPDLGDYAYESLVYDEDSDLVVAFEEGAVWTYDTEADVWQQLPSGLPSAAGQARYHRPSGRILVFGEGDEPSWVYDVDTVSRFSLDPGVPERGLVAYDRNAARWYLYEVAATGNGNHPATWEFASQSGWARLQILTPRAEFAWGDLYGGGEVAFDEGSGRIGLVSFGQLAAFDPTVAAWEVLYESPRESAPVDGPDFRAGAELVYDSANERLIVLGGWYGVLGDDGVSATDVWAYDGRTGEWVELLAAAN